MKVNMLGKRSGQGSVSPSQAQELSPCRRGLVPASFHHGIGSLLDSLLAPLHLGADSQRLRLLCSNLCHLLKSTGGQRSQSKWLSTGL